MSFSNVNNDQAPPAVRQREEVNNSKSNISWNKNVLECHPLSYLGQTSLRKSGRRACVVLSPDENDAKPENQKSNENFPKLDISKINLKPSQETVADMLPEIIKNLKTEMESVKTELENELKFRIS